MSPLSDRNPGRAPAPSSELRRLIDGLLADTLTRPEFARLEELLEDDPAARRYYFESMGNEALLPAALDELRQDLPPDMGEAAGAGVFSTRRWLTGIPAIAACLAMIAVAWFLHDNDPPVTPASAGDEREEPGQAASVVVAHLESESQATWVGTGPGFPGAPLRAGTIELNSGVAELRFTSGVLLALEAPARLELIDPMRCRLHWGTSLLDVPDSGKGFIVETSEGHAIDHGTRFVVMADHRGGTSEFEVLAGRISVHHEKSGAVMPLGEAQAARMTRTLIESLDALPSQQLDVPRRTDTIRLRTEGREACIVRDDRPAHWEALLDPRSPDGETGS